MLIFTAVLMAGCDSACRQSCRHVQEDCGVETTGVSADDCVTHCEDFLSHYEGRWQEDQAKAAVDCIDGADCADVRAGSACYDEAVWVW